MQIAREKEENEHKDKKIPVDTTGLFEKSYEVYYDEYKKAWDNYLLKVDLKNGIYGDYVFYKMQLLYDRNRDLYVVFTRWGRIGETGMNQRTPFNNVEEAKQDYRKMFKAKTSNNYDDLDNFVKQKKKYNLARINYVTTDYKDYLSPFDYTKCPKTILSPSIYDLFEEMSNVTMY
jgi:predicted DNA-binding WGR domain protein